MCFYRCLTNERAKTCRAADRRRLRWAIERSERRRRRESDATLAVLQKEKRWVSKAACRILHTFIETFHWRARMRRNANKGRHCQTCSQNGAAAQLKGRRRFFGTRRLAVPKWLKIHCGAVIVEASHSLLGGTEQKEATPRTSCRLPVKRRCFLTKTPLSAEHVAGGGCYGSVSATLSSSSIKEHTGHFLL